MRGLAAEVWGSCDGQEVRERKYGKGRVVWNRPLRTILLADGVKPDFEAEVGIEEPAMRLSSSNQPGDHESKGFFDFIHRIIGDTEVYFVANRNNRKETSTCAFRVCGRQPELWDPVTGQVRDAVAFRQIDGRITVPLELAPYGSLFVIFRRPIPADMAGQAKRNFPQLASVQTITGPWTVKFDVKWGGPESLEFAALEDWSQRPEDGIKHYSGTATYVKRFNLDSGLTDETRLFLDLGDVKNVAEVRLNGKGFGVVWTAPWQVEITGVVKPVDNLLEIEVVNLWPNRLIGDAKLPAEKRFTHTNIVFDRNAPLLSSGLLGPVRIMSARNNNSLDEFPNPQG